MILVFQICVWCTIPDSSQNQQQLCAGFPAGQQLTVDFWVNISPWALFLTVPALFFSPSSSLLGSLNQSEDWPEAHIISSPKTNHAQNKFSIWRESSQPLGKDFIRSCYPFPGDGIWLFLTIYSPGLCPVLFKWLNNRASALSLRKLLPCPVDPAIRKFFFDTQPVLFLFYASFYPTVLL